MSISFGFNTNFVSHNHLYLGAQASGYLLSLVIVHSQPAPGGVSAE